MHNICKFKLKQFNKTFLLIFIILNLTGCTITNEQKPSITPTIIPEVEKITLLDYLLSNDIDPRIFVAELRYSEEVKKAIILLEEIGDDATECRKEYEILKQNLSDMIKGWEPNYNYTLSIEIDKINHWIKEQEMLEKYEKEKELDIYEFLQEEISK